MYNIILSLICQSSLIRNKYLKQKYDFKLTQQKNVCCVAQHIINQHFHLYFNSVIGHMNVKRASTGKKIFLQTQTALPLAKIFTTWQRMAQLCCKVFNHDKHFHSNITMLSQTTCPQLCRWIFNLIQCASKYFALATKILLAFPKLHIC